MSLQDPVAGMPRGAPPGRTSMPLAATPWADPTGPIDTDALSRALQHGLPACTRGELVIDALRVLQARRSPSRQRNPHPVQLWLHAEVHDPRDGRRGVQRWMAKAFRDGAAATAAPAARAAATTRADFGDALSHLPALDLLLWAWPNDPTLTQLPALVDVQRLAAHLPTGLAARQTRVLHSEVLRYVPEQRATLRVTLRDGQDASRRAVVVKTFHDDRAALLDARFQHFWTAAARDTQAPLVAEPLGVDAGTRTLWQAEAHGVPLIDALRRDDVATCLVPVGLALARLHAAPLPTTATRGLPHWLGELPLRQKKIARAAPALAARAAAIVETLSRAAPQLPASSPTLIHGDFHPDQVWLRGSRAVFFDFDEFCQGDPMEDLAQFVVKLEQLPLSPQDLQVGIDALCAAYAEGGGPLCRARLAWYRGLQALLQTTRAFVFQPPGWRDTMDARLARTETLVQEALT